MPLSTKSKRDEGLIQKDGVWYARIVREINGKKRQFTKKGTDKTDARNQLEKLKKQYKERGAKAIEGDKLTFKELAESYRARKLQPAEFHGNGETRRKVAGRKSHAAPNRYLDVLIEHFGKKKVKDITASDLEHFKAARLKTKTNRGERTIASVNRELEVFRSCLRFAVREQWIIKSPFELTEGVISKADEAERDRVLSFDEETRLLAVCGERYKTYERKRQNGTVEEITMLDKGERRKHLRPLVIGAIETAMRRGELFQLEWRDIDFDSNLIRVRQTTTKTDKPRTTIITPRLKVELLKLYEQRKSRDSRVFGLADNCKNSWTNLCDTAKVDDLRFHDLRHTAITRWIRAGVPHAEAMKMSGHTSMKTFQRYLSITAETVADNVARMEAYHKRHFEKAQIVSETIN